MATLLLVHGAWHSAACWDQFAARLGAAGHDVHALGLRGHPAVSNKHMWHRIRDYVDDVRAAASRIDGPLVLVGHSMGGLVVQKYLETQGATPTEPRGSEGSGTNSTTAPRCSAAVLLASVPTAGAVPATLRFGARHPLTLLKASLTLRLGPVVGTPKLARESLFSPDTPVSIVDAAFPRLQDESFPAYLDMMFSRPRPGRAHVPVLVLAGGRDGIFTIRGQRATAKAYHTTAEVYDSMGHNLMQDVGWERVADRIDAWVREALPGAVP